MSLRNLEESFDGPDRPACGQHVQTPCITAHVEQRHKERKSEENQKNETGDPVECTFKYTSLK